MIIGIPKETFSAERRVALTPGSVKSLFGKDFKIIVENGAGVFSGFSDEMYKKSNARIVNNRRQIFKESDILLQVRGAGANPEKADFIKRQTRVKSFSSYRSAFSRFMVGL